MSNVGQQLVSGALSGFLSSITLQPLDLLKTRLQQADDHRTLGASIRDSYFTRLRRVYMSVLREDGYRGLWRGTSPTLARSVPGVALYFASLSQLRAVMSASPYFAITSVSTHVGKRQVSALHKLTREGNLISGAATRVFVGFVLNPVTVVKARYESHLYNYSSLGAALRSVAQEGPRGLLKGFVASSLRDAPYAGMFVVLYEGAKHTLSDAIPASSVLLNMSIHMASAASASTLATVVTHPFDVIKTRIQVRNESHYRSINQTVVHMLKTDGGLAFFSGLSLRLTRKVLSSVITWVVYEALLLF